MAQYLIEDHFKYRGQGQYHLREELWSRFEVPGLYLGRIGCIGHIGHIGNVGWNGSRSKSTKQVLHVQFLHDLLGMLGVWVGTHLAVVECGEPV